MASYHSVGGRIILNGVDLSSALSSFTFSTFHSTQGDGFVNGDGSLTLELFVHDVEIRADGTLVVNIGPTAPRRRPVRPPCERAIRLREGA